MRYKIGCIWEPLKFLKPCLHIMKLSPIFLLKNIGPLFSLALWSFNGIGLNGFVTYYGLNNGPTFLSRNNGLNFVMYERSFRCDIRLFTNVLPNYTNEITDSKIDCYG